MKRPSFSGLCALGLCLVLASACAAKHPLFALTDKEHKPRGKTLAVVAGLKRDINIFMAECMSQALAQNSTFIVTPPADVARSIPGYPMNIKGPYRSAYFEIEKDYSKTDAEKIREIQNRLKVDYLYVIWVPTGSTLEKKIVFVDMISQLFEGPQSREVGQGAFWSSTGRSTCFLAPSPKPEDIEQSLRAACEKVSKEIAAATGMKK